MANPGAASSSPIHPQLLGSNQAIRLLAVATGVNLSSTGDTVIPIINSSNWSVYQTIVTNASTSLATASGTLYSAASKGGVAYMTANTALSGNTASTVVNTFSSQNTLTQTGANLYFNVATAQGSAVTADVYVYGYDFSVQS
jgi:hypothetical protein